MLYIPFGINTKEYIKNAVTGEGMFKEIASNSIYLILDMLSKERLRYTLFH